MQDLFGISTKCYISENSKLFSWLCHICLHVALLSNLKYSFWFHLFICYIILVLVMKDFATSIIGTLGLLQLRSKQLSCKVDVHASVGFSFFPLLLLIRHLIFCKKLLLLCLKFVLYRQCLSINLAERSKFTEGEIQTFMAVDSDRTVNLCNSFHDMWR